MEMGSEESAPVIVEVAAVLDREPYYKLHNEITTELVALKIKNNFLQKKMVEYFKKRKVRVKIVVFSACYFTFFYA